MVALTSGATAFVLGWFVGTVFTNQQYKHRHIVSHKLAHVPDDELRKQLLSNIETAIIRDGLAKFSESSEYKTMSITFYTKDEKDYE